MLHITAFISAYLLGDVAASLIAGFIITVAMFELSGVIFKLVYGDEYV